MKHKHAEIIIAWANGAEVESKRKGHDWILTSSPMWNETTEYRVKPKRIFPETSLHPTELEKLYDFSQTVAGGFLAIANEAIKQYILDKEADEAKG